MNKTGGKSLLVFPVLLLAVIVAFALRRPGQNTRRRIHL
jgi:hypothetical protein